MKDRILTVLRKIDVPLLCVILGIFTVYFQFHFSLDTEFIKTICVRQHRLVLANKMYAPSQYRILNTYIIEWIIRLFRLLSIATPEYRAFTVVRVLQNSGIFYLGYLYWGTYGIKKPLLIVAIMSLGWGFLNANFSSMLAFDTYTDILLYLTAGIFIKGGKYFLIIPIAILAGLNRETGGLIPFMYLVSILDFHQKWGGLSKQKILIFIISMLLFAFEFFYIRNVFGFHPTVYPYGKEFGWQLFVHNLTSRNAYFWFFVTLGIFPFFTIFNYRHLPDLLKRYFWIICPVWFIIHFFMGSVEETRLFLVPQVIIFLPASFYIIQQSLINAPEVELN